MKEFSVEGIIYVVDKLSKIYSLYIQQILYEDVTFKYIGSVSETFLLYNSNVSSYLELNYKHH
jgi:hypothetical protein